MIIGFTGTRKELTYKQISGLTKFINSQFHMITEIHHGDCVGADAHFHQLINDANPLIKKFIHPPLDNKYRAFCKSIYILPKKSYLERNKNIVNSCNILLACPKESEEILISGTWSTVRYARKNNVQVEVFLP